MHVSLWRWIVAAVPVASLISAAIAGGPAKYPYKVVTTVGMVTDIVRQVAGDKADVSGIIGEGVDPHLYKATRNDIAALQSADVIFYSGLMLEGKMADALVRVARNGKPVFAVTERIDEKYLLEPPEFAGHADPHVWMDVSAWSKAVEAVAAALTEYDGANASLYAGNARRYAAELDKLHEYIRKVMATVPERQRVLITAHDAFNYFGRAYGSRVKGIQGISTESEAGLDDINKLVTFIVDNDVKAVFVETSVAEKNVRALIEGAKARGRDVALGGTLFSDAMGPAGAYEGTYIGMLDHNATTIARALGGEAPARGLNGKLRE
ncbi:Periplasmic zinc-binding protein TroA precursor [Phycisphaerae bacterium RAS1]|nr:Periplasmic zinc-binding protein TroA precursor [Phycisphaerae bacterium RAS1]